MSFGSLNILQHKSWHLYNEKNRERVRQDEEAAAQEADRKQQKVEVAESERRLALLRARANARSEGSVESLAPAVEDSGAVEDEPTVERDELLRPNKSSNFVLRTNPEREAEEKVRKERDRRRYNVYLDQSEKERRRWYMMPKKIDMTMEETGQQHKTRADPLVHLSKVLKKSKGTNAPIDLPKAILATAPESSTSSIDALRKERLLREQAERRKLDLLLNPGLAEPPRPHREIPYSTSSQYNPGLTLEAHRHYRQFWEEDQRHEPNLYHSRQGSSCRAEDRKRRDDASHSLRRDPSQKLVDPDSPQTLLSGRRKKRRKEECSRS